MIPAGALIWFPGEPGNSRRPEGFTTKVGLKEKYKNICAELYDCEDYDSLNAFVNSKDTLLVVDLTRYYLPSYYNPDDGLGWIDLVRRREHELTGETKMNIEQMYPGSHLKAADLQDREVTVTISHVAVEEFGDEKKPVVYFQGKDRGLALNKTNATSIAMLHGSETDNWAGKDITLFTIWTEYQGRPTQGIRIKMDGPTANAGQASQSVPAGPGPNDEIPF